MGSVPTFAELKARARQRIEEGSLPYHGGRVFAGYDGAEPCALCDRQITAEDVVYEVELRRSAKETTWYYFHLPCHEAWKAECAALGDRPRRRR